MSSSSPATGPAGASITAQIAGLSTLKGLVLYGATFVFAALYTYFMVKILGAADGKPPQLDTAMVAAAAALSGVLGSAFAVYIGVPTVSESVNQELSRELDRTEGKNWYRDRHRFLVGIRKILSLEPGAENRASWPLTAGIWIYALVASGVAVVYLFNRTETPDEIRALAIAFGGYVVAFVTAAYGVGTKK